MTANLDPWIKRLVHEMQYTQAWMELKAKKFNGKLMINMEFSLNGGMITYANLLESLNREDCQPKKEIPQSPTSIAPRTIPMKSVEPPAVVVIGSGSVGRFGG